MPPKLRIANCYLLLSTEKPCQPCLAVSSSKTRNGLPVAMWLGVRFPVTPHVIVSASSCLFLHQIRYSQDIGISASSASRFFLCSGLGSQVARLVTGRLCDFEWFIPRTFLHAGLALDAICSLLLTKISTYSLLLLLSLVYGISDGLMACGNILHTMSCLHGTQIPLGFGIAEAVIALAFAGGPPLGGEDWWEQFII